MSWRWGRAARSTERHRQRLLTRRVRTLERQVRQLAERLAALETEPDWAPALEEIELDQLLMLYSADGSLPH